jgi:hypothetical protein
MNFTLPKILISAYNLCVLISFTNLQYVQMEWKNFFLENVNYIFFSLI